MAGETCAIDSIFKRHLPHILEKIFFSLDYDSYSRCHQVSCVWNEVLISERFRKKAKSVYAIELKQEEDKLIRAPEWVDFMEVRRLLFNGVNPNCEKYTYWTFVTPLMLAACQGHEDVVELLLDFGADPNKKRGWESTPIHYAAIYGHTEVVLLLLKRGADPNIGNGDAGSPFWSALSRGQKEVVKVLLDVGADPNITDSHGRTSLHIASSKGYEDIVKLLLESGVDPDRADDHGTTPLETAVDMGFRKVAEKLIDAGAEPNERVKNKMQGWESSCTIL